MAGFNWEETASMLGTETPSLNQIANQGPGLVTPPNPTQGHATRANVDYASGVPTGSPSAPVDWSKLAGLAAGSIPQPSQAQPLPANAFSLQGPDTGLLGQYTSLASRLSPPTSPMGLLNMPRFNLRR